jgi:formylglycine-generating enzyme required for sulfatase activity
VPDYGLTAQLRFRQYRDTNTTVPNNYFNPDHYTETMIAFGARKRISGWMLSATAGVGRQKVSQDSSTTTQLYELAATSPAGSTKPGVNGLYDMGGNVWEWTATEKNGGYITRGASWWYGPDRQQESDVESKPGDIAVVYIGFRCVAGESK